VHEPSATMLSADSRPRFHISTPPRVTDTAPVHAAGAFAALHVATGTTTVLADHVWLDEPVVYVPWGSTRAPASAEGVLAVEVHVSVDPALHAPAGSEVVFVARGLQAVQPTACVAAALQHTWPRHLLVAQS